MADSQPTPRVTCLSLALLIVVAAGVAAALFFGVLGPRAGSWMATAAAALAAVAVFIFERRLKNIFWAMLAVVVLAAQPLVRRPGTDDLELLAQGGVLAGLAAVAVGWQLAYYHRFAWRLWPLVAGALVATVGLAAAAHFGLGLLAALLTGVGFLPAAFLARWRRLRYDEAIPSRLNVVTAFAIALLAPAAGVYLSQYLDLTATEVQLEASIGGAWQSYLDQPVNGFRLAELNRWCWPTVWIVLPLLAWGWWRSLRRGWRDWKIGQPPTAWLLTILALAAAVTLVPRPQTAPLVLVGLSVLLLVFWLADVWKGTVEQLILLPPEAEREPFVPSVAYPENRSAEVVATKPPGGDAAAWQDPGAAKPETCDKPS